jgi:K+-transporting ATPase KdpF subunit
MAGAAPMSIMNWVGLILAIALGVYLCIALLLPEKFQ